MQGYRRFKGSRRCWFLEGVRILGDADVLGALESQENLGSKEEVGS